MDLSLSDFLLEEQWHASVILHVYIVHSFGWQVVLDYVTCLWNAFTSVRSQFGIISAQLFVRVKTCHHFLHEYKWLHECQGYKIRISTGSKWCWTIDFSACDVAHLGKWVDGADIYFIHSPSCVWCYSDHQPQSALLIIIKPQNENGFHRSPFLLF